MSSFFIGVLSVFFLLYGTVSYYVGLRLGQAFHGLIAPYELLYWVVYIIVVISPFAARFGKSYFPGSLKDRITLLGDYWLAAIYYFTLLWALTDLLNLMAATFSLTTGSYPSPITGSIIVVLVALLLLYGSWNARHPRIKQYDITIDKMVPGLSKLHAVMVSDIHLGVVVGNERLEEMVHRINALQPDIVFLAGDTIDEDVRIFVEQKMPQVLAKLQSSYGVFAVLGNHEYIGGNSQLAIEYLQQAGVTVLVDQVVKVNNQFYVAGRNDRMAVNIHGTQRLDLSGLMAGIDHELPVILLDHQPYKLEEGQCNGVDLQLSGHTHNGQFFPNNLITRHIFEKDWGYVRKGDYQAIISCGFGTWGPPIRIGNHPEIIDIAITFKQL